MLCKRKGIENQGKRMHGEKREKRIGFDDDDMDYTSQTISILAELFV